MKRRELDDFFELACIAHGLYHQLAGEGDEVVESLRSGGKDNFVSILKMPTTLQEFEGKHRMQRTYLFSEFGKRADLFRSQEEETSSTSHVN